MSMVFVVMGKEYGEIAALRSQWRILWGHSGSLSGAREDEGRTKKRDNGDAEMVLGNVSYGQFHPHRGYP